eukprot:scaffold457518_cov19-Prasinocladus_malaysianus.AAC.1
MHPYEWHTDGGSSFATRTNIELLSKTSLDQNGNHGPRFEVRTVAMVRQITARRPTYKQTQQLMEPNLSIYLEINGNNYDKDKTA